MKPTNRVRLITLLLGYLCLYSFGNAQYPLDALDGVDSEVELKADPTIDAVGLSNDIQEVLAIPRQEKINDYWDLFADQSSPFFPDVPDSGKRVSILMYHGFTAGPASNRYQMSAADFRSQLQFLKDKGIPIIPLGSLADAYKTGDWSGIPARAVVITIDDGQRSVYNTAYPVLKEYGAPFTLALYSDHVGRAGCLSWVEIKEMMVNGAEIGCHTASHPSLKNMTRNLSGDAFRAFMERETIASRKVLEEGTGAPVRYFFFPYGSYTKDTQAFLIKAGYDCLLTTNEGQCSSKSRPDSLCRYEVYRGIDINKYSKYLP